MWLGTKQAIRAKNKKYLGCACSWLGSQKVSFSRSCWDRAGWFHDKWCWSFWPKSCTKTCTPPSLFLLAPRVSVSSSSLNHFVETEYWCLKPHHLRTHPWCSSFELGFVYICTMVTLNFNSEVNTKIVESYSSTWRIIHMHVYIE
jgi:hypothetical protein